MDKALQKDEDLSAPPTEVLAVDPRILQRLVEVRRQASRRRLRVLGVIAAVALCLIGAWGLTRTSLLQVSRVQISTDSSVPAAQVLAVTGLDRHPQLLDVRPAALAARLERLPWVASAQVSRSFPHTVRVVITTRTPVAQIVQGRTYVEVDRRGHLLGRSEHPFGGLPTLSGPVSASTLDARDGVLAAAAAMPTSLRPEVATVGRVPDGLAFHLRDGIVADLGTPDDLGAKAAAVEVLLAQADLQGISVMDVQIPSMPVLTAGGSQG